MPKLREDKSDCSFCGGKGREPTDLWAETTAMWQPCIVCHPDEYENFWLADNAQQLEWFVIGQSAR